MYALASVLVGILDHGIQEPPGENGEIPCSSAFLILAEAFHGETRGIIIERQTALIIRGNLRTCWPPDLDFGDKRPSCLEGKSDSRQQAGTRLAGYVGGLSRVDRTS